jgi:glycosyltransferase involved in cell wall biosynthesis
MWPDKFSKCELTAVMPVRNSKQHIDNIELIIESVLPFPIQLIVVADLYDSKSELDLKIRLKRHIGKQIVITSGKFNSPGAARNFGLKLAESSHVAFWDCDDTPNTENFLKLARSMKLHSAEIGVGNFQFSKPHRNNRITSLTSNLIREVTEHPGIWRMIFDQSRIDIPEFKTFKMAEDQIFLIDIKFEKRKIIRKDLMVYEYQNNIENQLTRDFNSILETKLALNYLLNVLSNKNNELNNQRLLINFCAKQILSSLKYRVFDPKILLKLGKLPFTSFDNFKQAIILINELLYQMLKRSIGYTNVMLRYPKSKPKIDY